MPRDRARALAKERPAAPEEVLPVNGAELTVSVPGQVVRAVIWGQPVFFTVTNPGDLIQSHHARGEFYEPEELEIIRRWCPPGAVFADIGSNIGNHALFAAKFLLASKVILFEPNPAAIRILLSNLALNGVLDRCDTSHLGIGLSDGRQEGLSIRAQPMNLGGGKLVKGDGAGTLEVRPGDDMLLDDAPTFLKIDVEGMETAVLAGLEQTIARHRPTMFIEVDNRNRPAIDEWIAGHRYAVQASFRRYRTNENLLLVPRPIRRGATQADGAA